VSDPDLSALEARTELTSVFVEVALLRLLHEELDEGELARRMADGGLKVAEESLPPILHNLEKKGLLRSRWVTGEERRVRCYLLTDEGKRVGAELLAAWARLRGAEDNVSTPDGVSHPGTDSDSAIPGERDALTAERREVERLRSDLLSTVSHELRTPLTLIRTSAGLLLEGEPDQAMRKRLVRNIKQSADRMHLLVTDMLDLVRLRSGRGELQLRYVDLVELAAEAAALMKPLLDEKRQTLELAMPAQAPRVMADHRRLEQVLLNLLSNANKFAPAGASIRVTLTEDDHTATVGVDDSGPGIPAEAQPQLFDQFYTGRTSSPRHNIGAGLGLPIAKGIVEAHGGRIWVESEVGRGSAFYFSLPKDGFPKEDAGEDTGGR
jgi:signal transduction histidine kinase